MLVGYMRVSTLDQQLDRQLIQLEEAGCEKIFEEKVSGKNVSDRDVFKDCLTFLRQADTLVVTSLDR